MRRADARRTFAAIMNNYRRRLSGAVQATGAKVDHYSGDSVPVLNVGRHQRRRQL
jgi:class 3 adenylate cyclase